VQARHDGHVQRNLGVSGIRLRGRTPTLWDCRGPLATAYFGTMNISFADGATRGRLLRGRLLPAASPAEGTLVVNDLDAFNTALQNYGQECQVLGEGWCREVQVLAQWVDNAGECVMCVRACGWVRL
jgi:hypothetical protein